MPPQLTPLGCQNWLGQAQPSALHFGEDNLAEECVARLSGVVSGTHVSINKTLLHNNHQLYALLSNKWLSDEHVNAGGLFITQRLGLESPTRIINSHFLGDLVKNRSRHSVWTPLKPRPLDADLKSHLIHTLLIPLHLPSHWTLLVVRPLKRTYCYADTLDLARVHAPATEVSHLEWWLACVFDSPYSLECKSRQFDIDQQTDSVSCGVAVMATMSHIAMSTAAWSQTHTSAFRMRWFLNLTVPANFVKDTAPELEPIQTPEPDSSPVFSPMHTTDDIPLPKVTEPSPRPSLCSDLDSPAMSLRVDTPDLVDSLESINSKSLHLPELVHATQNIMKLPQPPTNPLKQSKLNFPTVSKAQQLEMDRQRALKRKAEDEALKELEEKLTEEKLLEKRVKARDKKRLQRASKKAKVASNETDKESDSASGKHVDQAVAEVSTPLETAEAHTGEPVLLLQVAELSRPHRQSKYMLSGHSYNAALTAAKHVNWMHPFLFHLINKAAVDVGHPWSPAEIVKRLKLQHPGLFEKLRPQRISDWRDGTVKDKLKWKDNVLRAAQNGNHPGGACVRQPLLANHPDMVSVIKDRLIGLRITGAPVDTAFVRGFMIAKISEDAPELFDIEIREGKPFRCTSQFVRTFLHKELGWNLRRPTRSAQKIPTNVKEVLMQSFLRMACAIRDESIPSCCIVNSDQTQVVYSSGTQYTWHTEGDKQVPVLGKEEKRAFTLLVGISNDGQLLPLQAIYQGLSPASLPHPSAPGYADAIAQHVFFVVSMTATYWSTLETMKDYVILILVPFFRRMISTHQLPDDQRCIWQIDVWSIHRSEKFRNWLSSTYPWIILQFVPGGCTGLFQACDVGLQKVAKAAIRQKSLADIINETTEALQAGVNPATFVNDKSIVTLRNRSVSWINEAIKVICEPKLIKKAFALCAVPETPFNLSYESLTSHEARQAIRELKDSNPEFHAEITAGRPTAPPEAHLEPEVDLNSPHADEIPLSQHVQLVMGSANATDLTASIKEIDRSADDDSDDESTYEPPDSSTKGSRSVPESAPTKRELPRRAAKAKKPYTEWWNKVDLDG